MKKIKKKKEKKINISKRANLSRRERARGRKQNTCTVYLCFIVYCFCLCSTHKNVQKKCTEKKANLRRVKHCIVLFGFVVIIWYGLYGMTCFFSFSFVGTCI